jgi:hypothetical protein
LVTLVTVIDTFRRGGRSAAVFYSSIAILVLGSVMVLDRQVRVPGPQALLAPPSELVAAGVGPEVRQLARWIIDSQDHAALPFVIVDKARARLYAFDAGGHLRGAAPVLLGAGRGDGPAAPATPAGRFVADTGMSARSDGIVWVNAYAELSLHGAASALKPGRSDRRLSSSTVDDKRISDGSLHVGPEFYAQYLRPLKDGASIAYVLPEVSNVREVFRPHGGEPRPRARQMAQARRAPIPSAGSPT